LIDVGPLHLQAHRARLGDELDDVVGVVPVARHETGHELVRVVVLEPRGLVGDPPVRRRVRPVEAVAGEEGHEVEHLAGHLAIHAARHRAGHEPLLLLVHDRLVFFAHRAAEQVGAAQAVAGQHLGDLHDLLLVDDDPVGVLEDRLQLRVDVVDRLAPVLAVDEVVDHPALERAGPVERDRRHDVLELVRLELLQDLAEA
jgi:hypothetical protein